MRLVLLAVLALAAGCGKGGGEGKPTEGGSGPAPTSPNSRVGTPTRPVDAPPTPPTAPAPKRAKVPTVVSTTFFREWAGNVLAADEKYCGKVIEVAGDGRTGRTPDGRPYFGYWTIDPGAGYPDSVVCYLTPGGERDAAKIKGFNAKVTGTVVGRVVNRRAVDGYVIELKDCEITGFPEPAK